MLSVELSAGVIEYEDTGGEGPPLVFIPGLIMDGRLWREVVEELRPSYRCLLPTPPLGAHRQAMRADANLSLRGQGRVVAEFLDRLGLADVTLCFNDWSCAQTMVADGLMDRVGRLVLVSCETAGNYPPALARPAAFFAAHTPGGMSMMRRVLASRTLRALPFVYGQMSKRGVPDELMREWLEPMKRAEIRRDLRKYIADTAQGRRDIRAATPALGRFEAPVLVVWDRESRMMPNEEGRRLAEAFPRARLVEMDDCFTLVPLDRPRDLAGEIKAFLDGAGRAAREAA
jgi:pimeloyl-ACP methyl ester carboxylesterase